MAGWKRNTEGLKTAATKRSLEAVTKTEKAIKALIRERKTINFQTVAEAADVSVAWLYRQPEIRQQVEHLRQQKLTSQQLPSNQQASDTSKDTVIAVLRRQLKELRAKNQELDEENVALLAMSEEAKRNHLTTEVRRQADKLEKVEAKLERALKDNQELAQQNTELIAKNQEFRVQLAGVDALVAENQELKTEKQRLFNRVTQLEATERKQNANNFAKARKGATKQLDIVEVEF